MNDLRNQHGVERELIWAYKLLTEKTDLLKEEAFELEEKIVESRKKSLDAASLKEAYTTAKNKLESTCKRQQEIKVEIMTQAREGVLNIISTIAGNRIEEYILLESAINPRKVPSGNILIAEAVRAVTENTIDSQQWEDDALKSYLSDE